MIFSLVIPVYGNEGSIPDLLDALANLNQRMDGNLEAVFVVDGSPDRSLPLLQSLLPAAPYRAQLIALSRNFGSFSAIRAGLAHARGEQFAVMAADLQEPPELMLRFRELLNAGEHDVVIGTRSGRQDPLGKRLSSQMFWGLYHLLVQREMPPGGVDVFACNRKFRDQLLQLHELNSTLVGLVLWMGFRRAEVPYERRARMHGRSAWSFWRRVRYLLDSTFAFSDLPIRLVGAVGIIGMAVSLVLAVIILFAKISGAIPVPGYTATAIIVMFFGGLNAFGIALIGGYVWRTFQNTKGRPHYIIAAQEGFGTGADSACTPAATATPGPASR